MVTVSEKQMKLIAEICIIRELPVKWACEVTGLSQPEVSLLKNSHLAHIRAIDLLCERNAPLLKRITRKQIREAVALHVNEFMTTDEIDERLELKAGTCLMLTRSPIWKREKFRLTRCGAEVFMEDTDAEHSVKHPTSI